MLKVVKNLQEEFFLRKEERVEGFLVAEAVSLVPVAVELCRRRENDEVSMARYQNERERCNDRGFGGGGEGSAIGKADST